MSQAWSELQSPSAPKFSLELVHYLFTAQAEEITNQLDLLDRIRAGFFQAVFVLLPASSWTHARRSQHDRQRPLRSRWVPFNGDPSSSLLLQENTQCEFSSWVAEQALNCSTCRLILSFEEDLGGHSRDGPASIWSCREFQKLQALNEATRGSAFLCPLSSAERRKPPGILTNLSGIIPLLYVGWPSLSTVNSELLYNGPLPIAEFRHEDTSFTHEVGLTVQSSCLTPFFWKLCLQACFNQGPHDALRGGSSDLGEKHHPVPFSAEALRHAPSFSSLATSWDPIYRLWCGRELLKEHLGKHTSERAVEGYWTTPTPKDFSDATQHSTLEGKVRHRCFPPILSSLSQSVSVSAVAGSIPVAHSVVGDSCPAVLCAPVESSGHGDSCLAAPPTFLAHSTTTTSNGPCSTKRPPATTVPAASFEPAPATPPSSRDVSMLPGTSKRGLSHVNSKIEEKVKSAKVTPPGQRDGSPWRQ